MLRDRIIGLLHEEDSLIEIVRLIGDDVLPDDQKLIIEIGKVIRNGFLEQKAFHKDDTFVPLSKQKLMMNTIIHLYDKAHALVAAAVPISDILKSGLFDKLSKMKYDIPNDKPELFEQYNIEIDEKLSAFGIGQ